MITHANQISPSLHFSPSTSIYGLYKIISTFLSLFSQRFEKIEEEIEMLQCKLKNIEKGIAFSGKKTKTARSQGRKIQITVEHERPRHGLTYNITIMV
ncbi:hypothetical protein BDE02_09G026000 [Populus trichocarpa]|nr:hypothetical protein BDE02_09G026000 [Populus trichocarpa]